MRPLFLYCFLVLSATGSLAAREHTFIHPRPEESFRQFVDPRVPAQFFTIEAQDVRALSIIDKATITGFVLPDGRLVAFDVVQFRVLDEGAQVFEGTENGNIPLVLQPQWYYRGTVAGHSSSYVYFSLSETTLMGYIELDGERFLMMPVAGSGEHLHALYNERDAHGEEKHFFCDAEEPFYPEGKLIKENQITSTEILRARIAIDADYESYQKFGNDAIKAADYIRSLFGAASAIYERDINVQLRISFLRVWTTSADPYNSTSTTGTLDEFQTYWNTNHQNIDRTLAHLISMKPPQGGKAKLGALCWNIAAYGISQVYGTFSYPNNAYTWDVDVTTHEIGHNFNSLHTHNCSWNPPIDSCVAAEDGSCYSGTVARKGTIMSYCHLTSAGKDLIFHPKCIAVMRQAAENASCIEPIPPAPLAVMATHTGGFGIRVTWNLSTSAHPVASLSLYRGTSPMTMSYLTTLDPSATNYNDATSSSGIFYYGLRSIYSGDSSELSIIDSARVPFVRTFSSSSGTYAALTSPTIVSFSNTNEDAAGPFDIGFPFIFDGKEYTKFSIGTNGHIRLGTVVTYDSTATFGIDATDTRALPMIAPFLDDLTNPNTLIGNVYYKSESGVLTVEYKDITNAKLGSISKLQIEVKLMQNSNDIEFVYGTSSGADWTGAIGITNAQGGSGNYYSVQSNVSPFTVSQTTAANSLTGPPVIGTKLRFTQDNSPVFLASASPVEFGASDKGVAKDVTFMIANAGEGTLSVTSLTVGGVNQGDYAIVTPTGSFTLAPGASRAVKIRFTPSGPDQKTATLTVVHNAAGSPAVIDLLGRGVTKSITISKSLLDYGKIKKNLTVDSIIVLTNSGSDSLEITGRSCSSGFFRFDLALPYTPFKIAAGASKNLTIRFYAPSTLGVYRDTMTLSNSYGLPLKLNLRAEVVEQSSDVQFTGEPDGRSFVRIYPNPAHHQAHIEFALAGRTASTLTVTNALGQTIHTITNGTLDPGTYDAILATSELPAGVYCATLTRGLRTISQRFVIVQ